MFSKRVGALLAILMVLTVALSGCVVSKNDEEFVFGVILVGPQNDHGWSEAHFQGASYAVERIEGARMIVLDKMNSADRAGTTLEQVVDEMVSQGAQLIFTTSDDFADDTDVAAAKYPNIPFVHISGDHVITGKAPANVSNYMAKMEYMKAVAGCAAALKTETGSMAYLGPLVNSETRRLASAVYLGAQDCYELYRNEDPADLRFVVNWIGFWFNIPGVTLDPSEVADDMFNGGADVIISGIDTTEAIVKAGQRADKGEQVWAIPYDYEGACALKPEVCLGTPYFNWGPAYLDMIQRAKAGTLKQDWVWVDPVWDALNDPDKATVGYAFGDALSDEDRANLNDYISKLASGEVVLFEGPLNLQDGSEYVPAGEKATDDQIWRLPMLLEGMEGPSN
ncbi:MAG: BMP family ABC transporter substrate-binding protein [Chloroflexi bacterium]|nr:BMP family ABC transporter substrate-binding protein [Chloroflexota bacterium]